MIKNQRDFDKLLKFINDDDNKMQLDIANKIYLIDNLHVNHNKKQNNEENK
jgi:hypothetical protein